MLAGIASSVFAAGIYLALHPGQTYSTPVGGITSIPLTDGSRMTLNTDSAASIDMDRNARVVRLLKGEAYFEVVRAPDRPFVVQAGLREIIVLGTQFSVRRGNDALDVLVTEGQVRVQGGERSVVASAGQRVRVQQATEVVLSEPQSAIESAISWRTGYISLDDVPLAEAISEFNRYNIRKVQIRNAKIAELRVSGKFRSTNVESFVHLLRDHFGVQSRIGAQAIELGEPQSSHLPP